jgi:tRNA(fMet)-specific endonuclease VapC
MAYLLDTNHWSYLERGEAGVVERLKNLPPDTLFYMPVIAQGELLAGIEAAASPSRKAALRIWDEKTVNEVTEVLPVTSAVAEQYARIYASLRRAGTPISSNDIWIAAIAFANDLIVVTADRDLDVVPGLRTENWSKAT